MKKKRNKPAIIITAMLMFAGILLVITGLYGGRIMGLFKKNFDHRNLKPEDDGTYVNTDMLVYFEILDLKDKVMQLSGSLNDENSKFIVLDLSALSSTDKQQYFSKATQSITIRGRIRYLDEKALNEIAESNYRYFEEAMNEYISRKEQEANRKYTEAEKAEMVKWYHEKIMEAVIPYCIEVSSIRAFNWTLFIPAGILVFFLSFVLEVCFVFKLKKRIVLPIVFALMIIIPSVMLFNQIKTMLTIKKAGDGLYTMKNLECTDTQGMLDSGSKSINELISWTFGRHLYGAPNVFVENFNFGCSAFAAQTPDGKHIFGRNFDFPETDTLLIHSHPEGAYESIGIADIGVLGVGKTYPVSPDSPQGRLAMMITPYFIVDGMNEKGLAAGILQLNVDETHQDNGKPDLLVFCAIRAILDKCSNVDEALALLDKYDIHSDMRADFHLFVTDRSGRYVVVEWLDGKMVTTEKACCTNSIVAPGSHHDEGAPDKRMETIEKQLGSTRVVTDRKAMEILAMVKSNSMFDTEWSCIYNLDDFSVNICLDGDYGKVYTFSAKDLR